MRSRGLRARRSTLRAARFVATACVLLLVAASCRAPHVHIESSPAAAAWRDGKPLTSSTPTSFETPYFGRMRIDVEHEPGPDVSAAIYEPKTVYVELPPPLSRWLFPLDFPVELFQHLFGDRDKRVKVELERAEQKPLEDRGIAELIRACRAAAIER